MIKAYFGYRIEKRYGFRHGWGSQGSPQRLSDYSPAVSVKFSMFWKFFGTNGNFFFTNKYFSEKVTVKSFGIFLNQKNSGKIFFKNPGRIRKFFREFFLLI